MRFGNESSVTASWWAPYRSFDVITSHENVYVNNSWQNRVRAMCKVSLCLSRHDTSADTQNDLPGAFIRSGHLTWPMVKFSNWPLGVILPTYIWKRLDARNKIVLIMFSLPAIVQKSCSKTLIIIMLYIKIVICLNACVRACVRA